jgi:hypothetical protein
MQTQIRMPRCLGSLLLKSHVGPRQWPPPAIAQQVKGKTAAIQPSIIASLSKRQLWQPLWRTGWHGALLVCLLFVGSFAQPQIANAQQFTIDEHQYASTSSDASQQSGSITVPSINTANPNRSGKVVHTSRTDSHASWQSLLAALCLLLAGAVAIARKILK